MLLNLPISFKIGSIFSKLIIQILLYSICLVITRNHKVFYSSNCSLGCIIVRRRKHNTVYSVSDNWYSNIWIVGAHIIKNQPEVLQRSKCQLKIELRITTYYLERLRNITATLVCAAKVRVTTWTFHVSSFFLTDLEQGVCSSC